MHIHDGHSSGGDDYAQYIKEAKNIAEGRPYYLSNYVFNKYNNIYSPPQYPPGFPLFIAPVVKFWGIAIRPLCYFNSVIASILMFCFFAFFRKYINLLPACILAVLVTYSGIMIDMKQFILSDGTNLLFVMLYLILRNRKTFPWHSILLLSICATMAIFIRTQSILLIMAEGILLGLSVLSSWRQQKAFPTSMLIKSPSVFIICLTMALTWFLNHILFYCPVSTSGFYADFLHQTLEKGIPTIIRDNINFFLESIQAMFHFETYLSVRTALVTILESLGMLLCIIGFFISISRRLSFDDIFFVLSCGLMLYYTVHDARYFLPCITIIYYYCFVALQRLIPALTAVRLRTVGWAITFFYLLAGYSTYKNSTLYPFQYIPEQNDRQAFEYLKKNVKDSEIILCARPRMLTLYTDKKCMIFAWQHTLLENKAVFDSMQVKYLLVINNIAGDFFHNYLNQVGHPLDSNQIADRYMLYTLR